MASVMRTYEITVPGAPVGEARARSFLRAGVMRHARTKKAASYRERVQFFAHAAIRQRGMILGPVAVHIYAWHALPAGQHRADPVPAAHCVVKPDADNIAKAIMDALNGIAYEDDRQVCNLHVVKRRCAQGEEPRVQVYVHELGDDV